MLVDFVVFDLHITIELQFPLLPSIFLSQNTVICLFDMTKIIIWRSGLTTPRRPPDPSPPLPLPPCH